MPKTQPIFHLIFPHYSIYIYNKIFCFNCEYHKIPISNTHEGERERECHELNYVVVVHGFAVMLNKSI